MAETIIRVSHLKKYFKEVKAVDDISFEIKKGELFGFLGINGAGKSTTINMLCTLSAPTDGQAEICGQVLGKENEQIRKRIGVVYQNNCLDDRLSVKENLFVRGSFYEKSKSLLKGQILDICEVLELGDMYNRKFAGLSGGQKRRCEIARALLNRPELLFLDEPTTGLDPATRKNVWQSIERIRKETNMTVFLTTHYMEEATDSDYIVIIDAGKIVAEGSPHELKNKYASDFIKFYNRRQEAEKYFTERGYVIKNERDFTEVEIKGTAEVANILKCNPQLFDDFEVLKGNMDNVFIKVTGKELQAGLL